MEKKQERFKRQQNILAEVLNSRGHTVRQLERDLRRTEDIVLLMIELYKQRGPPSERTRKRLSDYECVVGDERNRREENSNQ